MRAALARALTAGAVLIAVAACGTQTPYDEPTVVPAGPGTVPATQVCPDRNGNAGAPQPVEGLRISAIVICDTGERPTSAYVEKRYTTDIEAAVAALGRPDEERPDGEVFCAGVGLIYPQVIVITADGKPLVPHLPVDACGSEEAVVGKIGALTERTPDQTLVIEPANTALEASQRAAQADLQRCPTELPDLLPTARDSAARAPVPVLPYLVVRGCTMEADDDGASPALRFMLGGGGYIADEARLQRGLDAIDVEGSCPTVEWRGMVLAYLVADEPLFFVEVREDCAELWTPSGFVGVLHGTDVETFT